MGALQHVLLCFLATLVALHSTPVSQSLCWSAEFVARELVVCCVSWNGWKSQKVAVVLMGLIVVHYSVKSSWEANSRHPLQAASRSRLPPPQILLTRPPTVMCPTYTAQCNIAIPSRKLLRIPLFRLISDKKPLILLCKAAKPLTSALQWLQKMPKKYYRSKKKLHSDRKPQTAL